MWPSAVLLFRIGHQASLAERDNRAIVHRVVECGACQHQAIHQRHRDAKRRALAHRAQHAAGGGTVKVDLVAAARITGRNHVRLAVRDEPHVADKSLIEDGVDLRLVVNATLGQTLHLSTFGGCVCVHWFQSSWNTTTRAGGCGGKHPTCGRPNGYDRSARRKESPAVLSQRRDRRAGCAAPAL